ncbi:ligand-binding sensor domain-containing protein [Reichenbachiella agariperforans]|nr:two-component regulator propeller domain-containing protein [Reichenbachiella agariperforans]
MFLGVQMAVAKLDSLSIQAPRLNFHHIDGLNNNKITAFCQDHDGYMWIGTYNGLHRYDGQNYRLFLHNGDSSALKSSRIKCLLEDSRKTLWVGSMDGLSRYVLTQDRIETIEVEQRYFPDLQSPNIILDFVEDPERERLLVASFTEGLLVYDYRSDRFYPYFEAGNEAPLFNYAFSSLELRALALDHKHQRLWVGSSAKYLNYLDLETDEVGKIGLLDENGHVVEDIVSLEIVNENNLWVGTLEKGVFVIDISKKKPVVLHHYYHDRGDPFSLRNNFVTQIYLDKEKRIWVCNDNGGLHLYDAQIDGFHSYIPDSSPNSITNISIRCVYQDQQNRLWVGTALEGVDIVDPLLYKFQHLQKTYSQKVNLSNNIIRYFHEDSEGRMWIATDGGGVNIFDPIDKTVEVLKWEEGKNHSLSSDAVLTMLEVEEGEVWVGTWKGGINIIDEKTLEVSFFQPENGALKSVFELIQDKEGMIWATSFGQGVQRIDPTTGQVKSYLHDRKDPNSLKSNLTFALFEDSQGNIWVGGATSGLYILRHENKGSGKFEQLQFKTGRPLDIANDWVAQIYEGNDQNIYCATSSGLIKVDPETMLFENVIKGKLPSHDIRSILQDKRGRFWIASVNKLSQYDPLADSVISYTYRDGLQNDEFTKNAAYICQDGVIYLGGTQGVNYFDSENIPFNECPPQVHITGLKLFNKVVEPNDSTGLIQEHISTVDEITFDNEQWRFTLSYIGLNYTSPEYNAYAFMLEGLDTDWNYVGNQKEVTYSHLPFGQYVFKVKAANNDGVWQESPASIRIIILPPWWLTWWAISAVVILAGLIIYAFIRWRIFKISIREQQLKVMVKERTAQLSEKNKELKDLNLAITDQAEELKAYNDALNEMNEKLEELVEIRTQEIRDKNSKLTKFAFDNAHRVRGPLTRIMGLMSLIKKESEFDQREFWIEKVAEASKEMDDITRDMGSEIDSHLKEE